MSSTNNKIVERPALASFFASIFDVPFHEDLKNIGELLYVMSHTANLSLNEGINFELVPAKLQIFKEKPYEKRGHKFGFVEFQIKNRLVVSSSSQSASSTAEEAGEKNNNNNCEEDENAKEEGGSSTTLPAALPKLDDDSALRKIHEQVDKVLRGAFESFNKFKLKRIPDPVVDHLRAAPICAGAKDPMKVLCMLASRVEEATTTTTTTASSSSSSCCWKLPELPITDMALLRQEHPDTFPAVASTESVSEFLKKNVPTSDFFALSV